MSMNTIMLLYKGNIDEISLLDHDCKKNKQKTSKWTPFKEKS